MCMILLVELVLLGCCKLDFVRLKLNILIRVSFILIVFSLSGGCYYLNNSINHLKVMHRSKSVDKWLLSDELSIKERERLALAKKVLYFVESDLGLKTHGNYQHYSRLDGDYVTYLLTVANRWQLDIHKWSYPIVGELPYRGFASLEDAEKEALEFQTKGFDTSVRGVTAYSTLGWFRDPILSSMVRYDELAFVETLIHELIHANIFFKNEGDFNEQIATFLGAWGAKLFYQKSKGPSASEVLEIDKSLRARIQFAEFLKGQKRELKNWYLSLTEGERIEELRVRKYQALIRECEASLVAYPKKAGSCKDLDSNAKLLSYGVYYEGIDKLSSYAEKENLSFQSFMKYLLENQNAVALLKKSLMGQNP